MNKILNRRHIYLKQSTWNRFPLLLERVDNYLSHSKYLELATDEIIIYGNVDAELFFGREVIGNDPDISHHEFLKVKDYQSEDMIQIEIKFKTYAELQIELNEALSKTQKNSFRLKLLGPGQGQVSIY